MIHGGQGNLIEDNGTTLISRFAAILGGSGNNITGTNSSYSTIGGGQANIINDQNSFIGGGTTNQIDALQSGIGGGVNTPVIVAFLS